MIMAEEKIRKRFPDRNYRKTIEITWTEGIFQTTDIGTGSMDPTTPSQWLTRRRNFQGSEDLKTLRICIVYGTARKPHNRRLSNLH
jgi:hypothetical protein